MSDSKLVCSGCEHEFTRANHLIQHFITTPSSACQAAGAAYTQRIRPTASLPRRDPVRRHSRSLSPSGATQSHSSDAFGPADEYTKGDFPGLGDDPGDAHPDSDEGNDDSDGDDDEEGEDFQGGWEPLRPGTPTEDSTKQEDAGDDDTMDVDSDEATGPAVPPIQKVARDAEVFVTHFGESAGAPVPDQNTTCNAFEVYESSLPHSPGEHPHLYAPFKTKLEWEVAQWAKMDGPSASSFTRFLGIDEVRDRLDLGFKTTKELNDLIDKKLPSSRPKFFREEVVVGGQSFDLYRRDVIECIWALYGDPQHMEYLCFAPERHYTDRDKTMRLFMTFTLAGGGGILKYKAVEANTPGATIIPVILSSDKTQVTLFRNKTAYPVYLTIGNLPKDIRRKPSRNGQVLLAYLPTSKLAHIENKAARRRTLANLFHACLKRILSGLKEAGMAGLIMHSGDGVARHCHPIFASYVGDYPEQVLVTCTYNGDSPVCECPHDELGNFPCEYHYRVFDDALRAVNTSRCGAENIKPVQHPFWEDLPYVDAFRSITPDILHQLLQGVVKHLIQWITDIIGEAELDARVRRLPPNHAMRAFHKGISCLSRVSGTEHKQICAFLLGLVIDSSLPSASSAALVCATRGLLDFVYLSRYPIHSDKTLEELDLALSMFHDNKWVFVTHGIREHFDIPKLHFLNHYTRAIRLFGTADNYNTEATERLHIDFAKDAYRSTNCKDEYKQMTKWLERPEKIMFHANYISWRLGERVFLPSPTSAAAAQSHIRVSFADLLCPYMIKMTKSPTLKSVKISTIETSYGASLFIPALCRFVAQFRNPLGTAAQIEEAAHDITIPFNAVPVFHRIKFINTDFYDGETLDSVHVYPRVTSSTGKVTRFSRFDTVLVRVREATPDSNNPLDGLRVGRVRVVFSLPPKSVEKLFPPNVDVPPHFAYVEWFTRFTARADARSNLYLI
ncbi:hypothetical protein CPB85DRAFT_1375874 [Mucidula mucida]|nr:hypothetical protein CPB85DRAFT_1375874 [Mucidula mucida]